MGALQQLDAAMLHSSWSSMQASLPPQVTIVTADVVPPPRPRPDDLPLRDMVARPHTPVAAVANHREETLQEREEREIREAIRKVQER
jgi:hypothetical protein